MNTFELWRLREIGAAGPEVKLSNTWWSKHNAKVKRILSAYDVTGKFSASTHVSSSEHLREIAIYRRTPHLFKEREIPLGRINKVFASRWLSDDNIIMGTKCNRLFLYNIKKRSLLQIPSLSGSRPVTGNNEPENCGIHSIDVNPSCSAIATGGSDPRNVAVYRLPGFEPLAVGEDAHKDWIFDLEWLDDEFLITGSRDSSLCLFKFMQNMQEEICCGHIPWINRHSKRYPAIKPQHCIALPKADKIRALSCSRSLKAVASVSLNSCVNKLDLETLKATCQHSLKATVTECVCLKHSNDESLFALGCKSQFMIFDARNFTEIGSYPLQTAASVPTTQIPFAGSSVRSVSWQGPLITLGTGSGEMKFFDVRNQQYLQCDSHSSNVNCHTAIVLRAGNGWLQGISDGGGIDAFVDGGNHSPHAIYTHCYDEYGSRLFAAGGPLTAKDVGNYAALWE